MIHGPIDYILSEFYPRSSVEVKNCQNWFLRMNFSHFKNFWLTDWLMIDLPLLSLLCFQIPSARWFNRRSEDTTPRWRVRWPTSGRRGPDTSTILRKWTFPSAGTARLERLWGRLPTRLPWAEHWRRPWWFGPMTYPDQLFRPMTARSRLASLPASLRCTSMPSILPHTRVPRNPRRSGVSRSFIYLTPVLF